MSDYCGKCRKEITIGNDSNDVSLNMGKHIYCEPCYQSLLSWWECWESGNYKLTCVYKDEE